MLGRFLIPIIWGKSAHKTICFVSATRAPEDEFWQNSPLGISLKKYLAEDGVSARIHFKNSFGLPVVYNSELKKNSPPDIFVFLHDDVWLSDKALLQKIKVSVKNFDVIGLAGNQRRVPFQPAWSFYKADAQGFHWDWSWLSGAVSHGQPNDFSVSVYGPSPAPCKLVDGVFIAVVAKELIESKVFFDERFLFDFYDLDFCRSASGARLSIGTWPIEIIHQSAGCFGGEGWLDSRDKYFQKWGD